MPAPRFPAPQLLPLSTEDREQIASVVLRLYREETQRRKQWQAQHLVYDSMFRGTLGARTGPWENSSNFHVPMPYWLVDSINTRMVGGIWSQNPLVSGYAEEAFAKSLPEGQQFSFLPKPFTLKQLVAAVKETMAS